MERGIHSALKPMQERVKMIRKLWRWRRTSLWDQLKAITVTLCRSM
jgi:hypothetical protein